MVFGSQAGHQRLEILGADDVQRPRSATAGSDAAGQGEDQRGTFFRRRLGERLGECLGVGSVLES